MQNDNPYAPPKSEIMAEQGKALGANYAGLGRPGYFFWCISLLAVGYVGFYSLGVIQEFAVLSLLVGIAVVIGLFVIAILRLKNIGVSKWFILLTLIPLVNIVMNVCLLAFPTGYADHRNLDLAGKSILLLCAILMLVYLFLFV
jgi:hypothetical protein